jgi:hypothetical protein
MHFLRLKFLPLLAADAKAFCLDSAAVYTHTYRFVCGATHLCADAKNVKQLNSRPLFIMCASIVWLVDILGNKTQPGSEICVRCEPFLFLPFIGKCAFDANNMRSFVLTLCRVAFHQKYFFQYN